LSDRVIVNTTINGEPVEFLASPRDSLLDALRYRLALTGAKEGCNNGNCGACSVLLNGRLVNSCLVMVQEIEGQEVRTVEGVAGPNEVHPVQQAFLDEVALQCGICTPGFVMSTLALLDENPEPTPDEARFWLAGNLCRCTGYDKILRAVETAAQRVKETR
jgi:aerobic carbon-monoxide dehydrogenase small subunit